VFPSHDQAGGSLGTARYRQASSGTLTAGLAFGGTQPPETNSTITDEYDGSSWTTVASLGTAITNHAAGGTQTSSIGFGGSPNQAQAYNGTTWSNTPSLATPRRNLGGAGASSSSALAFGGGPGNPVVSTTEEFTKSINTITAAAWASGGNLNLARSYMAGMGTQTAALAAGGNNPGSPATGATEEYDGASWTTGNNLAEIGDNWTGCGTQTAAMGCGGYLSPGVATATQLYDGTNWTTSGTLNIARYNSGTFGIQTSAVTVGGGGASPVGVRLNSTEHFNGSAWTAVPGTLNTARRVVNCFGTQTAGVAVGGNANPGIVANVEEYNGSAWTNATAYPSAKNGMGS
jgi:hypothetical protein